MLSFTHTHSGPALCREDADKPGGALIAPYLDFLGDAVQRAVENAIASAVPAVLEWSCGKCGLAQNRDLPDPSRPRFLTGYNPLGMPDDTLLVGRASDSDGRCIATLVNYAIHPEVLGNSVGILSPDLIGPLNDRLEKKAASASS